MRKGVVGKRNKKIRKIKKKLNTMWLEEGKDVAEKQIKKYRKIKKK